MSRILRPPCWVVVAMILSWGLAISAQSSSPTLPTTAAVHGHFVVLGQEASHTVAYARIIIDPGYRCPTIVGHGDPVPMTTRDNPQAFPVIVCEAQIGFGQNLSIQLLKKTLPLPTVKPDPEQVLVFGDSGCKAPKPGSTSGCPLGTPAEPFASLAKAAASGTPDLILHVGDYNYRGTKGPILFSEAQDGKITQVEEWPYDAGDGSTADENCEQGSKAGFWSQNAENSNYPDHWSSWKDDFFSAASELLPKAPWIFARGNHELCSRAGPGWFYFLDPSSNLGSGQRRCPDPDPTAPPIRNVVMTPPYAVDLGSLRVVVLDSTNACDAFTNKTFTQLYTEQFNTVAELSEGGRTWLLTHRPIWGVNAYESGKSTGCTPANTYSCMNQTLQTALAKSSAGALPATVTLHLAGHMHRFESLTFPGSSRPPVIIAGTGGVALESWPPVGVLGVEVDGAKASGLTTAQEVETEDGEESAFGYLAITYDGSDGSWTGKLIDPAEELTLANCGSKLASEGSVCRFAKGVKPVR